jgi:hypothetical protein
VDPTIVKLLARLGRASLPLLQMSLLQRRAAGVEKRDLVWFSGFARTLGGVIVKRYNRPVVTFEREGREPLLVEIGALHAQDLEFSRLHPQTYMIGDRWEHGTVTPFSRLVPAELNGAFGSFFA